MKRRSGVIKVPFPSPRVQRLQRPSILCNPRLVFFFRCQEPFCLQSITDNAGEALFVKYVSGIRVVSMEVISPDLWVCFSIEAFVVKYNIQGKYCGKYLI